MKNYIVISILLLGMCIVACHKSGGPVIPPPPPPNPDSLNEMTVILDSVNWAADSISGRLIPIGNDSGRYNFSVTAKKTSDNSEIILYISDYQGNGQYVINPPNVSATYYVGGHRHYSISGQITFTSDAKNDEEGTFDFVADSTNGFTATSGSFRFSL